eukprot:649816-Alexandrium_andersonii.AAC.1
MPDHPRGPSRSTIRESEQLRLQRISRLRLRRGPRSTWMAPRSQQAHGARHRCRGLRISAEERFFFLSI